MRSVPYSEQPVDCEVNDVIYEEHLFQHDIAIHCYEKLIKTNKDELLLLSMKPMQFEYKYEPMYFGNWGKEKNDDKMQTNLFLYLFQLCLWVQRDIFK